MHLPEVYVSNALLCPARVIFQPPPLVNPVTIDGDAKARHGHVVSTRIYLYTEMSPLHVCGGPDIICHLFASPPTSRYHP